MGAAGAAGATGAEGAAGGTTICVAVGTTGGVVDVEDFGIGGTPAFGAALAAEPFALVPLAVGGV